MCGHMFLTDLRLFFFTHFFSRIFSYIGLSCCFMHRLWCQFHVGYQGGSVAGARAKLPRLPNGPFQARPFKAWKPTLKQHILGKLLGTSHPALAMGMDMAWHGHHGHAHPGTHKPPPPKHTLLLDMPRRTPKNGCGVSLARQTTTQNNDIQ